MAKAKIPADPNKPKQTRKAKTAAELYAAAAVLEAKENAKKITGIIAKYNFAAVFNKDPAKDFLSIGDVIKSIKDEHKVQVNDVLLAFVANAGLTGLTITGKAKPKQVKK